MFGAQKNRVKKVFRIKSEIFFKLKFMYSFCCKCFHLTLIAVQNPLHATVSPLYTRRGYSGSVFSEFSIISHYI